MYNAYILVYVSHRIIKSGGGRLHGDGHLLKRIWLYMYMYIIPQCPEGTYHPRDSRHCQCGPFLVNVLSNELSLKCQRLRLVDDSLVDGLGLGVHDHMTLGGRGNRWD